MEEHNEFPAAARVEPRSVPFEGIWSKFTSKVGDILTDGPKHTGKVPASVKTTMITINGPVPVTTKTVDTTKVITSFVTTHLTTAVPVTHPTLSGYLSPSQDPPPSSSSSITTHHHTTSSPVVTGKPSDTPTLSLSFASQKPINTPSSTPSSGAAKHSGGGDPHRTAIIGGLSGAIAGLVLIGVLIVFFLRRRRNNRSEDQSDISSEKGFRPAVIRKWSELTTAKSPSTPILPVSRGSTVPDLDGGLLRVSLDNWPRPFARGESWRESMGPRRLQVMNPSPTRPNTPLARRSSESAGNFLYRQRNALAAVFLGANRSRSNSSIRTGPDEAHIPTISVDPAMPSEGAAPHAPTPSFRSYSSVSSLPFVEQRPPEDPFLTPPDERAEDEQMMSQERPRRPSIAPLQGAAGAAGRTLSNLGSALNPFRGKTNTAESLRSTSHQSFSTFSSAGDPFKWDSRSLRGGNNVVRTPGEVEREAMPKLTVYEGT